MARDSGEFWNKIFRKLIELFEIIKSMTLTDVETEIKNISNLFKVNPLSSF